MKSHPDAATVLDGLGAKVTAALARAVALSATDLKEYRTRFPVWVSDSSERGLANWIHDRIWAHLASQVDGEPGVRMSEGEPTRELVVGLGYRLRVKRHREDAQVSSYPTQTALEFFAQGVQETFPGLEETRLIAGYVWLPDTREVGEAVLSMRDGRDHVLWQVPLSDTGTGYGDTTQPLQPITPEPSLPSVNVPEVGKQRTTEDDKP